MKNILYAGPLLAFLFTATAFQDTAEAQVASDVACKGCVGKKDLAKNAVTKRAIRKNAVTARHLAKSAKPAGVDFVGLDAPGGDVTIDSAGQLVASVDVTAPGPGYIVVNADYVAFSQIADRAVTCGLLSGGTDIGVSVPADADMGAYRPISFTRTFAAGKAGTYTIDLGCRTKSGDMKIRYATLTALFVPSRY